MGPIRHRAHSIRSSNVVWHIDSTYKQVKNKLIASGDVGGNSRCTMLIKCSNNSKVATTRKLFKENITNHVAPLQVHGNKG